MVRLRAPVLQPPTVRDFFSYEGHASGQGARTLHEAWYRLPVFYFSNTLRIFGPEDEVPFPSATESTRLRDGAGLRHRARGE